MLDQIPLSESMNQPFNVFVVIVMLFVLVVVIVFMGAILRQQGMTGVRLLEAQEKRAHMLVEAQDTRHNRTWEMVSSTIKDNTFAVQMATKEDQDRSQTYLSAISELSRSQAEIVKGQAEIAKVLTALSGNSVTTDARIEHLELKEEKREKALKELIETLAKSNTSILTEMKVGNENTQKNFELFTTTLIKRIETILQEKTDVAITQ